MTKQDDKVADPDRRGGDRRLAKDSNFNGPERRSLERRDRCSFPEQK